jgi:hypothetical protein
MHFGEKKRRESERERKEGRTNIARSFAEKTFIFSLDVIHGRKPVESQPDKGR